MDFGGNKDDAYNTTDSIEENLDNIKKIKIETNNIVILMPSVKEDDEKLNSRNDSNPNESEKEKCQKRLVKIAPKLGKSKKASQNERKKSISQEACEPPIPMRVEGRLVEATINSSSLKRKIPRPANAFMLFANEWRKQLAAENPRDSNKDISVRLGVLWKSMTKDVKEKYFALAREVDAEHKRKYPGKYRGCVYKRLKKDHERSLKIDSIVNEGATEPSNFA